MALTSGDVATGRRWAEEALELHRTLGDAWGTAFSLLMVRLRGRRGRRLGEGAAALRRKRDNSSASAATSITLCARLDP